MDRLTYLGGRLGYVCTVSCMHYGCWGKEPERNWKTLITKDVKCL